MIRTLLQLIIVLIIGVLTYNYFFGTSEEKASSKRVFGEVKTVFTSVNDLVRSERSKLSDGKYDAALDKIEGVIEKLRGQAKDSKETLDRINELEAKRRDIEESLRVAKNEETAATTTTNTDKNKLRKSAPSTDAAARDAKNDAIKGDIQELLKDTEKLVNEMDK